ncbi:hypothetical protein [Microbacterium candidum]|uniref:Uncharacterized protein n=1 Tax=Microbacterium candidum TaxID=3041922 RepID=A0ABT7MUV5_9MICO|nr:hypothetical protein [Microbacterium sp. ASV49]MDL9978234.1 hypothetical protein [Microbacterium sp. ASV49]
MNTAEGKNTAHVVVWLWLTQLVLTLVAVWDMFWSQMSMDSCAEDLCDYSAFMTGLNAFYFGAFLLLVGSGVGAHMFRGAGRRTVLFPIAGILGLLIWLALTYTWGREALQLPLFGNRL